VAEIPEIRRSKTEWERGGKKRMQPEEEGKGKGKGKLLGEGKATVRMGKGKKKMQLEEEREGKGKVKILGEGEAQRMSQRAKTAL
jgi:hypothetical protein